MVVIMVCDNDTTLVDMRAYLRGAGIDARATRRLSEAWALRTTADAVLLFPDDFDREQISNSMPRWMARSPHPLLVLVTGDPSYYETQMRGLSPALTPVILPKPVWGWTIVDVLRQ